jgi:hypothetical protein
MKKDYTDITVLLDRSGSMASIKNDMVNGLKAYIVEQAKLPGQCLLTLVQFDSVGCETVFTARPIGSVENSIELFPRGSTPLLDSLGKTIAETGNRLSVMPEYERPEFVIMLIITDGEENCSREFTRAKIKEMIDRQTLIYKWTFVYLGANQDAFQEAGSIGISGTKTMDYAPNQGGIRCMFASTDLATTNLRSRNADAFKYGQTDYAAQAAQKSKT